MPTMGQAFGYSVDQSKPAAAMDAAINGVSYTCNKTPTPTARAAAARESLLRCSPVMVLDESYSESATSAIRLSS